MGENGCPGESFTKKYPKTIEKNEKIVYNKL